MTTTPHGTLNNNRLVEAIFELRYETKKATENVKNSLVEHLRSDYAEPEELTQQVLHFQFGPSTDWKPAVTNEEPDDLIRYRFKARNGNRLVQLGKGIFSFNELSYSGFDKFREDLRVVLRAHEAAANPSSYRRLGLRYINHFPFRKDPESIFRWAAQKPSNLSEREVVVSNLQQTVIRFDPIGFQRIVVTYPQLGGSLIRCVKRERR